MLVIKDTTGRVRPTERTGPQGKQQPELPSGRVSLLRHAVFMQP